MSSTKEVAPDKTTELTGPVRVSITGIDGAGKDTVARAALGTLSQSYRVVKLGRPAYVIDGGVETQIFSRTTETFDAIHRYADRHRSPRAITVANAVNVLTQARILEPLVSRMNPTPQVIASTRDPRLDPAVYLSYYVPASAKRMSFEQRINRVQALTGVSRDLVVVLGVSPTLAVERIQQRVENETHLREELGTQRAGPRDKWMHVHENVRDLTMLSEGYALAIAALRTRFSTPVVEINTDERSRVEVAELVSGAIAARASGAIGPNDWYQC